MPLRLNEFDIIFAGGGAAACVTAGRLAAADPSLKILIVEAGPRTEDDPAHIQPARFLSNMLPDSKTMKFLIANPSEHLGGRSVIVPAGQCIGGGSSVNFAVYNRGAPSEYDEWETTFQNPGWGSKDILPLLQKMETFEVDPQAELHGTSGPLRVSYGGHFPNVSKYYLDVAASYDKQRRITENAGELFPVNVYGRWPKWICKITGRRSDAAHRYIYPILETSNVQILSEHIVKRVIIENGRAIGIEYTPNLQLQPNALPTTVYAKKWVVVSGGSFGSPLILERSGIGSSSVLRKNGISQIVDLPGVGERYQDHQLMAVIAHASEDAETLDDIIRGDPNEIKKWTAQWLKDGTGMMAHNGMDAGIRFRPTEAEVRAIGPAFEKKWREYFADHPDRSVMWVATPSWGLGALETAPTGKFYGVGYFLNHPSSIGHVHITSGKDPLAPPDFDTGYLEHEEDMELHVFAYKLCREFTRRMACFRGEYPPTHPKFSKTSLAAINEEPTPVALDAPDITYTEEDNNAIRNYVRERVGTTWHALGTCAMMPREQGGVVDSSLNVYGVKGLKVADLSIAPCNVSGNTYATVGAIAEKAALILAEDLSISLSNTSETLNEGYLRMNTRPRL
ncbi:hypothetical protein EIP91_001100 [Steccherinum ochraceum]|uniref:Glucose-methanol-choline oxidoreductase N-terminal domain-containing protein n=1 Tax=Steccherinum ochraceum TaxID=92696 RepID=A0A4R0RIK7_9APHY|nr:hypothetical protein EIP91_001100 [Steccherinum ochraceum]